MAKKKDDDRKIVADNRKARFSYSIESSLEAGIALVGSEVKSLRTGKASIAESYAQAKDGEIFLINANIPEYNKAARFGHEPKRTRKLLVHKREIRRLFGKVKVAGYTLVPTKMYFKDGRAKVEIALAKGKTEYDKRDALAKKEAQRDVERALHSRERE